MKTLPLLRQLRLSIAKLASNPGLPVADNCICPICVNRKCPTLKIARTCTSGQSVGKSQQEWSGEPMHGWETRMLLRHYLERGVTRAELSRRFGVDRRTIHRWVGVGSVGQSARALPRVEEVILNLRM